MRPESRSGIARNDLAGDRNASFTGTVCGAENFISLSIDEHRELGREMKAAAKRLRALCELVVGVYGPANRAAFSFLKAMEAIEHLEQDLATQAIGDKIFHLVLLNPKLLSLV